MTGICGATGPSEEGVAFTIDKMLRSSWRRGTSTQSSVTGEPGRFAGIGICQSPSATSDGLRQDGRLKVAIDGFFYDDEPLDQILRDGTFGLSDLVGLPGAFAFVGVSGEYLVLGRDPVGQKPLYFGESPGDVTAFASLRGPLLEIGVRNLEAVIPGTLCRASTSVFKVQDDSHRLKEGSDGIFEESEWLPKIHELLSTAVLRSIPSDAGIAFSGGLDSAVLASIARENGGHPELFTVGLAGRPEIEHAHRVAVELGLPITIIELEPTEVLESLSHVVSITESIDPVVVGVSIPLYFACRKAAETGRRVIAAGQISDELFGGYSRFEKLVLEGRTEEAMAEMWKSVQAAPTNDFEPGDKVAVSLGLEMRSPFAYLPLVEYVLRLPLSAKISVSGQKVIRKHALRQLAARLKLPEIVVKRPKQAVQYSSGVQRILVKEAKRRTMSINDLLKSYAS